MNHAFRLKLAKRKGEATAKDHGFTSLPVDPFMIAAAREIEVLAKPETAEGVSGMLLRHGDNFGIAYATHIPSEGFQRFSVAHELGHYFLDGHIDHILPGDGVHASHAGFVSKDPYEQEADNFAAGLLMPERLFQRAIGKFDPGLNAVEGLHSLCKTSLTATAIRYAELSEEAVAVVLSSGSEVMYCCLSELMKSLDDISWLRNGDPLPRNSVTFNFNNKLERVASAERDQGHIDIIDWLGGSQSLRATEQVVGLGSYGKTLTVLTCPSIVDRTYLDQDDEEEEDADLIDRWTPKFHK